jgi:hypothetical protein
VRKYEHAGAKAFDELARGIELEYRRQIGIDAAAAAAALEGPDAVAVAVGGDGDDPAPLPAGREFSELDPRTIGIG